MKLPGLGKVSKKTLAIGGVVGGGVLAYAWYRHSRSGAAAAASGTGSGTTAGTTGQDIDPVTGYPYGSAEDTAALAAQQDSGLDTNLSGTGDIDPETGYPYGSLQDEQALGLGGGGGGTTASPVTTNAEWEQQAIADLEAGGVSQATVSAAESGLPRYLAKLKLSGDQASAVQMAVGLAGPPPVGGPYAIIPEPPAPKKQGGGGGQGSSTVTVPDVKGKAAADAVAIIRRAGLDPAPNRSVPKGQHGTIISQTPGAGKKAAKGSRVGLDVKISR